MTRRSARAVVRLSAALVPADRREEWLEEWLAEIDALEDARSNGTPGLPSTHEFALGALPHALWMKLEGWTMDSVLQDLRYSLRGLRRNPGFALMAAATLALGIGANASIFSLVNGLLFRAPEQIEQPNRLVQIARSYESAPRWDNFSWPAMQHIQQEATSLSGVAAHSKSQFVLGRGNDTESVIGEFVTGNFFSVLGVQPAVGRMIQPTDAVEAGAHPVVVLGHGLWTRRFGADPTLVGRTIAVGSEAYEVIGIAAEGFVGVETLGASPAMWVPATQIPVRRRAEAWTMWGYSWISVFGRLADGVEFAQAESSMTLVSQSLREASAENADMVVLLAPGIGMDPQERTGATQLAGFLALIVGLLLLLTCTNVANLFLSRATARRTEVSVRMALGAGRSRLARQFLTESLLISALATAIAVPVIYYSDRFLPLIFPIAVTVPLAPDGRVYLFLIAVGLATGLLFGLAPALAASGRDLVGTLREASSSGVRTKTRLRDLLVVSQLGLSLSLVFGAALLTQSVINARRANPGFDPDGLAVGFVNLGSSGRYDDALGAQALARMVEVARQTPGVSAAALGDVAPIVGGHGRRSVRPEGRDDVFFEAEMVTVGGGYFETLGIPIVQGRALLGLDDEPEPVVVVNETLARMFWPDQDPIGKRLQGDPGWRVVGVAGDVQMRSLRSRANPGVYYPIAHAPKSFGALHVRGEGGTTPTTATLRAIVAEVDSELPVSVVDLRASIAASMGETRTFGFLVGAFAVLALVLAAVGLYGLVAFGASQRVREMGIRMALGAKPESLVRLILGRGLAIAMVGVGLGVLISLGLARVLQSLLFGVTPNDPRVLVVAATILLATATLAAWLPARRASRVDAAISLRD